MTKSPIESNGEKRGLALALLLRTLPPAMRLQDKSMHMEGPSAHRRHRSRRRDWPVDRPYMLFRCQNGKHAIVRVQDDGGLSTRGFVSRDAVTALQALSASAASSSGIDTMATPTAPSDN